MAKTFEEPEEDQAVQDAWEARVPKMRLKKEFHFLGDNYLIVSLGPKLFTIIKSLVCWTGKPKTMSSQSLQLGRSDCEQRWSGWLTRVNLWMTVGFLVIFWHSSLSLSVHNVWSFFSMWNWRLSVSSKGDWLRGLQKISRETQQRQASWLNAYTRFKLECPSGFFGFWLENTCQGPSMVSCYLGARA